MEGARVGLIHMEKTIMIEQVTDGISRGGDSWGMNYGKKLYNQLNIMWDLPGPLILDTKLDRH